MQLVCLYAVALVLNYGSSQLGAEFVGPARLPEADYEGSQYQLQDAPNAKAPTSNTDRGKAMHREDTSTPTGEQSLTCAWRHLVLEPSRTSNPFQTRLRRRDDAVTIVGPTSTLLVSDGGGSGGGGGGGGGGLTTDQNIAIAVGVPATVAAIVGTIIAIQQYRKHERRKREMAGPSDSTVRVMSEGSRLSRTRIKTPPHRNHPAALVEAPTTGNNGTQAELPGSHWRAELGV